MRWNVNMIMELTKSLTNKNQAGSISATDLFYRWNTEQMMYWQDVVGRWQARANGKEGMNTGLMLNETILGELAPFTIPTDLTVSGGMADKPEDFEYRISLTVGSYKCWFIRPDQIAEVNHSYIDPPSISANKFYATE